MVKQQIKDSVAHIVSLPKEVYCQLEQALSPSVLTTWVDGPLPSPHFWLLSAEGDLVVFTPVQIEKRESRQVLGLFV